MHAFCVSERFPIEVCQIVVEKRHNKSRHEVCFAFFVVSSLFGRSKLMLLQCISSSRRRGHHHRLKSARGVPQSSTTTTVAVAEDTTRRERTEAGLASRHRNLSSTRPRRLLFNIRSSRRVEASRRCPRRELTSRQSSMDRMYAFTGSFDARFQPFPQHPSMGYQYAVVPPAHMQPMQPYPTAM